MINFTQKIKREIIEIYGTRQAALVELATIFIVDSKFYSPISDDKCMIILSNDNSLIINRVFNLIKINFNIFPSVFVTKKDSCVKYTMIILPSNQSKTILDSIKYSTLTIDSRLLINSESYRSFIRGCFLICGYVNNPEKSYHMEFSFTEPLIREQLKESLEYFGIKFSTIDKKYTYNLYLKDSESISDVLNIVGANKSYFEFTNQKLLKEVRNNINRQVNFETANIKKIANASYLQAKSIEKIQNTIGLEALESSLREIAELRLRYPNAPLKELGSYLIPPLGKSGVNHRLKKIIEISNNIN